MKTMNNKIQTRYNNWHAWLMNLEQIGEIIAMVGLAIGCTLIRIRNEHYREIGLLVTGILIVLGLIIKYGSEYGYLKIAKLQRKK